LDLLKSKHVWYVLNDLLADLIKKGIDLPKSINRDLRHSRFIIVHYETSKEEHNAHDDYFQELQLSLDKIIDLLFFQAESNLGIEYSNLWKLKLEEAQMERTIIPTEIKIASFLPEIHPRTNGSDFVLLSFTKPIEPENIRAISKKFRVQIDIKSNHKIHISGKRRNVKDSLRELSELYQSQIENSIE
jgi:hypothetical protein